MKNKLTLLLAAFLAVLPLTTFGAEGDNEDKGWEEFLNQFEWTMGPNKAQIGAQAEIQVPEGFRFTGQKGTINILEGTGNFPSGDELGLLINDAEDYWVLFEFDEIGYVKDDDKDELDADKMLKSMQEGNKQANKMRESQGIPTFEIAGWQTPPHYDEASNNLEWGIRLASDRGESINYNTRLLGRKGVMEVTLICDNEQMTTIMPAFRSLLDGYDYISGEKYAEYQEGDKIAKYGLAALVLGGAAVGAAKLGLFAYIALFFKKAGKAIILVIVAIGAFFKKVVSSIFGGRKRNDEVDTY